MHSACGLRGSASEIDVGVIGREGLASNDCIDASGGASLYGLLALAQGCLGALGFAVSFAGVPERFRTEELLSYLETLVSKAPLKKHLSRARYCSEMYSDVKHLRFYTTTQCSTL